MLPKHAEIPQEPADHGDDDGDESEPEQARNKVSLPRGSRQARIHRQAQTKK
jgi:hypothetical protein